MLCTRYLILMLCGLRCISSRKQTPQNKIIGGKAIAIEKIPYIVGVIERGIKRPVCGGSIITKKHIVTAAHCIVPKQQYSILAGSKNFGGGVKKDVVKTKNHPKYEVQEYDISILTLKFPLKYSKTIKKITLASKKDTYKDGAMATVSGFGTTQEGGGEAKELRSTDVPILDIAKCKKWVDPYTPNTICAGFEKGGKDSCQGDSGGPLVHKNKLVGIVSYGIGCGRANNPGVYTDVRMYLDFIMKETNKLKD